MADLINLNSSNIVPNGFNNVLRYEFSGSSVNFTNSEITIQSIGLNNSQFNIDKNQYANTTFSIKMPTGATTSTINIDLKDGYYSYSTINGFVRNQLETAGAYLIDGSGNYVHYIRIQENPTYYACQIDLSPVPISLPVGWSRPATGLYSLTGTGLPTTAYTPQITIQPNFNKIVGFTSATYPATQQTSLQTFLSNFTPEINPVSNYIIRCNLINNKYSNPPDIIGSFTNQGTTIGQYIEVKPNEYTWLEIPDSVRSYIEIIIMD
ncbi:hypothetical protein THRCLA_22967 [Thraustotheca clavata]|uniref:Uncharacterized protein n=1 Tax=Thraustotheca clavata TaxID=74557 RepID=A0A1V9YKX9_9STRA|nr:hypothetical protein THRCLA_22967 [Thraustotheca clavata]